jgi:serine/threonine-protein kinase
MPPPRPEARSAPAASEQKNETDDVARLARFGASDGPDASDTLTLFRALRATPDEGRAIEALLARASTMALPDPIALAIASALVDRGEPARALDAIAHATSSAALLVRADLVADAGDTSGALALVERVLLRDLDLPGARERHRRWREALGLAREAPRVDASAATVVTNEPEAPFRLLREIARGGAGAVYEAEDRELGRRVALKVYHHPERDRAQLTHEARVAAALAGPNVVRVLDADPDHGWLALEWAPRGALRDAIRACDVAALAPLERWAIPLAAALARAHAAGWIHHDVKPANVLLASPDVPLLSDFGIARRAGEPSPAGSFGYVAPERLAGRASDPRDDVYGFGRIIEDVLDVLDDNAAVSTSVRARWRALAAACVGVDTARPPDARALLTRLRIEVA